MCTYSCVPNVRINASGWRGEDIVLLLLYEYMEEKNGKEKKEEKELRGRLKRLELWTLVN